MESKETCQVEEIHQDVINNLKKMMIDDRVLYSLADFFKVFGDSTRIKILFLLTRAELCVCDLAELLNLQSTAVSHQLRTLKLSRLVKYRKDGKKVYYSLDDKHVEDIIKLGLEHIEE